MDHKLKEREFKNVSVVIADDSPTQAMHLQMILEGHGFDVTAASNGVEALKCIKEKKPTLLISDVMMPEMNGYELCQSVRANKKIKNMPVILLTTLSAPDDVIHALACGADSFVTKPYEAGYLIEQVREALENDFSIEKTVEKPTDIHFAGHDYSIAASRLQILGLLMSTYQATLQKNKELIQAQKELRLLNETLEKKVEERTAELRSEIEERKQAQQRLVAQYGISKWISESSSIELAVPKVIKTIGENIGCNVVSIWTEVSQMAALRCVDIWQSSDLRSNALIEMSRHTTYKENVDLLSQVWLVGKAQGVLIADTNESLRATTAQSVGLRTWTIEPIFFEGKVVGVMELFWKRDYELDYQDRSLINNFSIQLGEFIGRKKLEQQFLQSQKMENIGQLTGGIAHDFNNLLMVVQGNLEAALGEQDKDKKQLRVQSALQATETGTALTRRLLAFSRQQPLAPKQMDMRKEVENAAGLLKPVLGASIVLATQCEEGLWPVYIEPSQFENAIVNLAVNARDAMPHGGKLLIEAINMTIDENTLKGRYASSPGDYVKISVTDTGTGMTPETIEHMFEPFYTTKGVGKGTGLGMSMVYGFIKQSKGYITVYSEVNYGTTISMYLPRMIGDEMPTEKISIEKPANITGTEKILVVEDEAILRELVVEYLRMLGYQVLEASDGQQALAILTKEKDVQLLYTDIIMPGGVLGPELAEKARKLYPKINILFASGYPKDMLSDQHVLSENAHILIKPYRMNDLGVMLKQIFQKKPS